MFDNFVEQYDGIVFPFLVETQLYNIQPRYSIICNIKEKHSKSIIDSTNSKAANIRFETFINMKFHTIKKPLWA